MDSTTTSANEVCITDIIIKWEQGDNKAKNALYTFAYQQFKSIVRKVKSKNFQDESSNSIAPLAIAANTTSLVHDAFIKMSQHRNIDINSRQTFYRLFAQTVYSILVDQVRKILTKKRSQDPSLFINSDINWLEAEKLVELESELKHLAKQYDRQVTIFLYKYVCIMPLSEVADILQISASTVDKDLSFIKSLLTHNLSQH